MADAGRLIDRGHGQIKMLACLSRRPPSVYQVAFDGE